MKKKEKATVVVFVNNKGGVGKTRHAILTADCLAKAGYRVLVIDMDFNNSSTYFYLTDEMMRMSRSKNIKAALNNEESDLCDFTLGDDKGRRGHNSVQPGAVGFARGQ